MNRGAGLVETHKSGKINYDPNANLDFIVCIMNTSRGIRKIGFLMEELFKCRFVCQKYAGLEGTPGETRGLGSSSGISAVILRAPELLQQEEKGQVRETEYKENTEFITRRKRDSKMRGTLP